METFVNNIKAVNDKYNDIYITYFLYRIWIKYKELFIYSSSREEFNKILDKLHIPKDFHKINVVFPLSKFMFYKDKEELDKVLISSLFLIDTKMKDLNTIDDEIVKIKKDYDNLMKYINDINSVDAIEEITNQFRKKIDLQFRNVYIKGLIQ